MNEFQKQYSRLDKTSKRFLQLLAFHHTKVDENNLIRLTNLFNLSVSKGQELRTAFMRVSRRKWIESGLLTNDSLRPVPILMDTLIREGISSENSQTLLSYAKKPDPWVWRDELVDGRGQVSGWPSARSSVP
jgi:hypothetical protein